MPRVHATLPRLYVPDPLATDASVPATEDQTTYLCRVMRLGTGDEVLLFNGRDGEWLARIAEVGKRGCRLIAVEQARPQAGGPDLHFLFAPLKRARLDYLVQKATELGVAAMRPVHTRRTQAERVNLERMRSNVIEAAEQCGVLRLPEVLAPMRLEALIAEWDGSRRLLLCDEEAPIASPLAALSALAPGPLAVLVGPEGGFAPEERTALGRLPAVTSISLGPRIMRADTAAVAVLALVNAVLGDWR